MPAPDTSAPAASRSPWKGPGFGWMLLGLGLVLATLFFPSFDSRFVVFSNDGPLGANSAASFALPSAFQGIWADLNWVGGWTGSALPTMTYLLTWILKAVGFAKFYAPFCLLLLGLSAWLCFRRLGFHPMVCLVGGLAAALNMDFFSYACWGLGTLVLCVAAVFLALAAIGNDPRSWLRCLLAGLAVGLSVMEGFDNGAIFSLYVAAFVLFQSLIQEGPPGAKLARGVVRVGCVAVFAAFIAAQALSILTGTQIKGIVGAKQDKETRAANWAFATQVSLPKIETLRILIPGLFGYGIPEWYGTPAESYGGANYWGSVGQDADWEAYLESPNPDPTKTPRGSMRSSGGGPYAGVLVVLVAGWAIAQLARKRDRIYTSVERKHIWFWSAAALVSLLFAFGRYAPFYRIVYALPYFSTIRIPYKWLHPFNVSLLILFGYGLQGLYRRYLANAVAPAQPLKAHLQSWWRAAAAFDRRWTAGTIVLFLASLVAWLLYAASRNELERHLQRVGFSAPMAASMAAFSLKDVGIFIVFLALAAGCLALILSGWFGGRRVRWAGVAFGVLVVVDLGRANKPWIVHYDYKEKYASNPIIDFLRDKPYEHRVSGPKFPLPGQLPAQLANEVAFFQGKIYYQDWLQNLFPFYNVQSLDIIQMPRTPEDIAAFQGALSGSLPRLWQLTNTRYLLTWVGFLDALNQQLDPAQKRFRLHTAFELYQNTAGGPILIRTNTTGPFALIEFSGALPRARLYSAWQVSTNDAHTLQQLANPMFDPAQTVLVAGQVPALDSSVATHREAGTVAFKSYAPKRIEFAADAGTAAVLLFNDRFDPYWKVRVDGQPATVLRCNFLMRGVYLKPGPHTVEFRFEPPTASLYVSLAAVVLGIGLCGFLAISRKASPVEKPAPGARPEPKTLSPAKGTR